MPGKNNLRFACPVCKRKGTFTILARNVPEGGGLALLLKGKAPKIMPTVVKSGNSQRVEVVVTVRCPRCKSTQTIPGRMVQWRMKRG